MSVKVRTKRQDPILKEIVGSLKEYAKAHPLAHIDVYRYNSVSVRVRVVNPEFARQRRSEREMELWRLFEKLPEETVSEISLLLLFTPEETERSIANQDFEDPAPSRL